MTDEARELICQDNGVADIQDIPVDIMDSISEGYCINCGTYYGTVEQDAEGYHCDACGLDKVTTIKCIKELL